MTLTKYITTAEAAEKLGVSQRYVSLLINDGRIKAIPLGRALRGNGAQPAAWMIDEKEIEAFAALPRRPPGRPAGSKSKKKPTLSRNKKQSKPRKEKSFTTMEQVREAMGTKKPSYQELMAQRRKS